MAVLSTLPSLRNSTLDILNNGALTYDRSKLQRRVVHLGPGAFFRAHQADYFDRLNMIESIWGITGISLRSDSVAKALGPQDGLYTLVTLDYETDARVVGALLKVLYAGTEDILSPFLSPDLVVITLTITEKGYCLKSNGAIDLKHPDIQHDLENPNTPISAPGLILLGLKARFEAGLKPPFVLSCDNLPANGEKLRNAVLTLANFSSPALTSWIAETVEFPLSMVDSITPASDEALRQTVAETLGINDAWPIQRERFIDWVIQTPKRSDLADLSKVGATFTNNVSAYEQAKLRLLNGPHSTLAYYGLLRGFDTVHQAISDPEMCQFIEALMTEIIPSISAPDGLDLNAYGEDLLNRFSNPAIAHNLSQIAWDGSQKLPIRLLATIADNLKSGVPITHLCRGVAAWWRFVIRRQRIGADIVDPMKDKLLDVASNAQDNAAFDIPLLLSLSDVFPLALASRDAFRNELMAQYTIIMTQENWATGGEK